MTPRRLLALDPLPARNDASFILLKGHAGPATMAVTVNGQAAPLQRGEFAKVVDLEKGPNVITVVARDWAGNLAVPALDALKVTVEGDIGPLARHANRALPFDRTGGRRRPGAS